MADGTGEMRLGAIARGLLAAGVLAIVAAAPWWGSIQVLRLMSDVAIYVALATLWNLLAGYAGLVSVGQQAFVGLGGYAFFALTIYGHLPPLLAIPIVGLVGAIVAVPTGLLLFRLRGAHFAIGSWIVAEVFRLVASQTGALGGGSGTSLPASIVVGLAPNRQWRETIVFWTIIGLTTLIIAGTIGLLRSRQGLGLRAIRDNEGAARACGVEVQRLRFGVYVLVAFGTAAIGAVIFLQKLRISPDAAFSVNDWTALVIFMTVIGGVGRVEGPVVGTLIFFALRESLSDLGSLYLIVLGVIAIGTMLVAPKGLWGVVAARFGFDLVAVDRRAPLPSTRAKSSRPGRADGNAESPSATAAPATADAEGGSGDQR